MTMKPIYWIPLLALLGGTARAVGYAIFRATGWLGATTGVIAGVLIGALIYKGTSQGGAAG